MKSKFDGQLSIFDINESNKNGQGIKINEINSSDITLDEKNSLNTYNMFIKNRNVVRVIRYYGGGMGIETNEKEVLVTHYINRQGKEEFTYDKPSRVFPEDKIIYCTCEYKLTDIQIKKLNEIYISPFLEVKRVIRRKGDRNICIESNQKILIILENGWILEFKNTVIECMKEEILKWVVEV